MKLLTAILTAALAVTGAQAQATQRFTASKANEYGLVYSLPQTQIDITITATHTRRVPGEFYNYARRHLGINDAITNEENTIALTAAEISTSGTAAPDNRWLVQFKSGSSPYIELTPAGTLLSVNAPAAEPQEPMSPEAILKQPTILERDIARQAMTQDMIRSSSTSKRAELAAARIFELRDIRSDVLSGQSDNPPADGKAMQLVLDNLSGQEKALTAMFAGTTQTWTEVTRLSFIPDSTGVAGYVLARVSPYEGILEPDNLAGAPVYLDVTPLETGTLPVNEKGEEKRFPKGGLAYNIPGTARVTITYEGAVVATAVINMAQNGVTFGLDPNLFTDKKAPSEAIFDPSTGALLTLRPMQ